MLNVKLHQKNIFTCQDIMVMMLNFCIFAHRELQCQDYNDAKRSIKTSLREVGRKSPITRFIPVSIEGDKMETR